MRKLSYFWGPQKQVFSCDDVKSEWDGKTVTDPSHDLAHLIIAANGELHWVPYGNRDETCFAEYNAVLLENFFDKTCNAILLGSEPLEQTLVGAVKYGRWFVDEHFAPFPISSEEAYRRFCRYIDPQLVARLFPYYLYLKRKERANPAYREEEYQLEFTSIDAPDTDADGVRAQHAIRAQLEAVKG